MSKLPVKNVKGERTGEFDLADELLVYSKGAQAMHDAVVAHEAHRRAGTASTLTKGEVSGSNAKPWRQKGTGRARAGYRQSPIWRGGSVAFGPKPRDYSKKMSKKAARLAFRRAFSEKVAAGEVVVLEELTLAEPKTKDVVGILQNLEAGSGALIIMDKVEAAVSLATRNLPKVAVAASRNVSTYQVVRYPLVVVTRKGMEALQERLQATAGRGA